MSEIVVANIEELRLLSRRERLIYEMFRHEGKTREEICEELNIGKDAFRRHWWSAMKKIREYRKLTMNPQYFLSRGKDVLSGHAQIGISKPAETKNISNTSMLGRDALRGLAQENGEEGVQEIQDIDE